MQEQNQLPIVSSGKYAGKSITELMADQWYIDNVLKKEESKAWFNPSNKNWGPIYNIIVNQTLSTNKDGKTPEHNKLQNMFLDKNNQSKLLLNLFKNKTKEFVADLEKLFADEEFIRCFGIIDIPELTYNLDKDSIKFEDKYNWDFVLYNCRTPSINFVSNLENELTDKQKYKTQYDIAEKEKYENELLLLDELITIRVSMDKEEMNKYEKKMHEYENEMYAYKSNMSCYDFDMKFYVDNIKQNQIDVDNYEKELKIYEKKREQIKIQKEKEFCNELGINYDKYVKWYFGNDYSNKDNDYTHTVEDKRVLQQIITNKVNPFLVQFDKTNKKPKYVKRIHIPSVEAIPIEPKKPELNGTVSAGNRGTSIIEQCRRNITNLSWYSLDSVCKLEEIKNKYQTEYQDKYEEKFNKHYEKYRIEYYNNIIRKCFHEDKYRISVRLNENHYEINISINSNWFNFNLFCELKPQLSDDYPCVLRKLQTQIELTKNYKKTIFDNKNYYYLLVIDSFTSKVTTKEELIKIFKQHHIKILFTDEIFGSPKLDKIKYVNSEQTLVDKKFVEENKFLADKLLQTQQELLQTQEKLLQAEEKNKQLEAEIISFKTQKQTKTIKDYFGKK